MLLNMFFIITYLLALYIIHIHKYVNELITHGHRYFDLIYNAIFFTKIVVENIEKIKYNIQNIYYNTYTS